MANNPFANAFTNYESSGNQSSLGSSKSGGFNPNDVQNNYQPWQPPNPVMAPALGSPGSTPPIATIPFGSYGSGAEAPSQGPTPTPGGSTPPAPAPNLTALLRSRTDSPVGGNFNPDEIMALGGGAPMQAFGAAKGGAIPAYDDGGTTDGQMSAMDMGGGGYYSGNSNIDNSSSDNYTVNLASALGDVMQTLQDSRAAVTGPITGGQSAGEGSDQVAIPANTDQATGANPPSNPTGQDLTPPQPVQTPAEQSTSPIWHQTQVAANDKPPLDPASTSRVPGSSGSWNGPVSRPGQPAPPINIGPATDPSKLGTFGKLADLGTEGTQFMAAGGSVGTKAYDLGGSNDPGDTAAIPDSPGGAAGPPIAADDDSPGALEQADLSQAQQAAPPGANPQMLARYASGADAMDPATAQAIENQVDPDGSQDPVARRMQAIASQPDKKSKVAMLQHHRRMFNLKRHAARAALDRGNKAEAVRMANSATQHLPFGHSYHITPNGNKGVHVHIRNLVGSK